MDTSRPEKKSVCEETLSYNSCYQLNLYVGLYITY